MMIIDILISNIGWVQNSRNEYFYFYYSTAQHTGAQETAGGRRRDSTQAHRRQQPFSRLQQQEYTFTVLYRE